MRPEATRRHARAIGYARVSSAEQALGTSLQDQQDVIRAHAKARGLTVARIYVEAESAVYEKAERREQIQALMADVREGDLVLVDKIDRWSRDPEFTYGSIREILKRGAGFFAIGDNCDPSTPDGDSMMGIRVYVAREEHKRIRIRTVGTRRLLKNRGYFAEGLDPWGYQRQRDAKGLERNHLVPNDKQAEEILKAFRLCIEGSSLRAIGDALSTTKDRVKTALHNRVYLGEIRDGSGQWIKGQHKAIVDAATFLAAQDAIERRRKGDRAAIKGSETDSWWLREIARCALCRSKMSACYAGSRESRRYYYFCFGRCTSRYVNVRVVEAQADPIVLDHLLELRAMIATAKSGKPKAKIVDAASIDAAVDSLQKRRARYAETYAEGHISREAFNAKIAKLDLERTQLEAKAKVPAPVSDDQRRRLVVAVTVMSKGWNSATPDKRRVIVRTIAEAALLAAQQLPRFDWFSSEDLARRN